MSSIWESPIYPFRIPIGTDEDGNELIKEIVVDVTTSAPSFSEPGKTLGGVLTSLFDYLRHEKEEKIETVLDFGAGKLRNTVYLLEKNFAVTAVEYEKLFAESEQAQGLRARAKEFGGRFRKLVYPHEFLESTEKHDMAILINVLNIMPVPSERLLVLQQCYDKIRQGGLLFWYTQYGDADYKRRCTDNKRLGDGYYVGDNRKFKSFYREFSVRQIDEMLGGNGFRFEKSFPVAHNQARLYRKQQMNLLRSVVNPSTIRREIPFSKDINKPDAVEPAIKRKTTRRKAVEPNPQSLNLLSLYIRKLTELKPGGGKKASAYQQLVKLIFARLFDKSMRNIRLEETMFDGRKRIDIVATNCATSGFFERLSSKSHINCNFIPIECKNYTEAINNPEFDQIGGRLYEEFGMFGFLVYRKVPDKSVVLKRCQDHLKKHEFILALDDNDLINLLNLRQEDKPEEIEDYLDNKLRALVLIKDK